MPTLRVKKNEAARRCDEDGAKDGRESPEPQLSCRLISEFSKTRRRHGDAGAPAANSPMRLARTSCRKFVR